MAKNLEEEEFLIACFDETREKKREDIRWVNSILFLSLFEEQEEEK